ncbi:MAG: isoprenylcysteine carboxylmethyltransferase family protein [Thermoanaerobaculia bacterium]
MTQLWGVDTRWLFTGLFVAVALQRLAELVLSNRHMRQLLSRGAQEAGRSHYPVMVALHTAALVAAPVEVWWLRRPFLPGLATVALAVALAALLLRVWVIRTLGERWTTRVIVLPGAPVVAGGPYRFLRHPNYLAVILELAALPLVHTAWVTALAASLGNAFLLRERIRVEERALAETAAYQSTLGDRPRLVPNLP